MYTAYRLNDPNEVMPPHRHSPNAVRFGLTGAQNFTGVEGENITFGPGDLVLTPHDTWHNHGNTGNEPAINLSVLDLPLVETLNAIYFEHDYKEIENGKLMAKRNTFSDFVACADHLVETGWVHPDRLGAEGGSAGGLLIGAAVNLAPERFRVVHAAVPFVDSLTTILDPTLPFAGGVTGFAGAELPPAGALRVSMRGAALGSTFVGS